MNLLTGIGGALAAVALLGLLLGPAARWMARGLPADTSPKERHDAVTANRDLLLKCLTGLVALGALAYTAQTFLVSQQQAATALQGQVTDRYTKAVEELDADGPGKEDTRIGAVYALERLMGDSPRDHATVVDVLTSFVRHHGQNAPTPGASPPDKVLGYGDFQAALTVLGRRDRHGETHQLDLRKVAIAYLDLKHADLYRADFFHSDLHGTHLDAAGLRTASLVATDLKDAHLRGTDLRGAHLNGADLTGADLTDADLRGTDFTATRSPGSAPQPAAKGLTCDELRSARVDGATRLPSGLSCGRVSGQRVQRQ